MIKRITLIGMIKKSSNHENQANQGSRQNPARIFFPRAYAPAFARIKNDDA
jgi:hypothetical protein